MSLTEVTIKNTSAKGKPFKLYDANGLYLHFSKAFDNHKGRVWRYRYRFNGKEKSLTIGRYPLISLKDARLKRDKAYLLISEGVDPSQAKQDRKQAQKKLEDVPVGKTFKEVAYAWGEFKAKPNTKRSWKYSHKKAVLNSLEREVLPVIGDRVIHTITRKDIDAVISPIQERGALEVASRSLHRMDSIFRYGMYKEWCDINPALGRGEFLEKQQVKHMSHIDEKGLPAFLNTLENYQGNFVCKSAVKFVLLTHVRTNELRFACWDEIDFEARQWHIPAEKMKMNISQTIPLSKQAIEVLEALRPITGTSRYIFASIISMSKPISENGMLSVIYNMNYKGVTTIHGLRGTFSTIANETLKFRRDVIEASLAHKVADPVRGAYNHATYLEERKVNAQLWADYLDRMQNGADVIPIKREG